MFSSKIINLKGAVRQENMNDQQNHQHWKLKRNKAKKIRFHKKIWKQIFFACMHLKTWGLSPISQVALRKPRVLTIKPEKSIPTKNNDKTPYHGHKLTYTQQVHRMHYNHRSYSKA